MDSWIVFRGGALIWQHRGRLPFEVVTVALGVRAREGASPPRERAHQSHRAFNGDVMPGSATPIAPLGIVQRGSRSPFPPGSRIRLGGCTDVNIGWKLYMSNDTPRESKTSIAAGPCVQSESRSDVASSAEKPRSTAGSMWERSSVLRILPGVSDPKNLGRDVTAGTAVSTCADATRQRHFDPAVKNKFLRHRADEPKPRGACFSSTAGYARAKPRPTASPWEQPEGERVGLQQSWSCSIWATTKDCPEAA